MFENPRRGRQARNFTTTVPKILDLKSSSEQILFRKWPLGAPDDIATVAVSILSELNSLNTKSFLDALSLVATRHRLEMQTPSTIKISQ